MLSSLIAGAYGQAQLTPLLTPLLGPVGGAVAAIIVVLLAFTVLQVVLCELLSKNVALRYSESLAMAAVADEDQPAGLQAADLRVVADGFPH